MNTIHSIRSKYFNKLTGLIIIILMLIAGQIHAEDLPNDSIIIIEGAEFYAIGDQIVERQLIDTDQNNQKQNPGQLSYLAARPEQIVLWQDGVIPFKFKKDVSEQLKVRVLKACNQWAKYAKITCQEGEYKGRELTVSTRYAGFSTGCWSMLGQEMKAFGIKRRMNLSSGCEYFPLLLHEVGHALGFTHEHQRHDRDQYINIFKENIDEQFMNWTFKLNFATQVSELFTPYDFLSIMHYGSLTMTKNGNPTMLPRPEYSAYQSEMGSAQRLSENDIAAIQLMYGPR